MRKRERERKRGMISTDENHLKLCVGVTMAGNDELMSKARFDFC